MADSTVALNNVTPQPGDNSQAPTQTTPTPSNLPAQAPGADKANAATLPAAGPVAQPKPAPQPVAGQDMSDQSKSPNLATRVLSNLMGGKPTTFAQTDKGPVPVTRDWKPGELARHVVASAASLIAAGIGGEQAAKNKQRFELAPGTSLGDIKDAQKNQDEAQAQKQFENDQNVSELALRQHRDAREQQQSMQDKGNYDRAMQAWQTAHANNDLVPMADRKVILQKMQDMDVDNQVKYQQYLTMPGAQVMKDASGKELNFATGDEAKAYVTAHPEVVHGSTNGKSMFGVVVVANPYTGATQLIDYPADRHEAGLSLVGAKKNADGSYEKDSNGDYVPDGTVLDPRTQKPTYLTQTVTPDQARTILSKGITEDKVRAQMDNFEAHSKLYTAEINKYPELKAALSLSDTGNFAAMTDAQKKIAGTFTLKQEANLERYKQNSEVNLLKLQQQKLIGEATDEEIAEAQQTVDDAKDKLDDVVDKYNNITGNTAGIRFANKAIRQAKVFQQPWAQTNAEIEASAMPSAEQQIAKDRIWNSLTPAQRAQVNPTPETQAKAVTANQENAPAGALHKTPANAPAQGFTYIYDPQGTPYAVKADLVDKYLASPDHKGWTK